MWLYGGAAELYKTRSAPSAQVHQTRVHFAVMDSLDNNYKENVDPSDPPSLPRGTDSVVTTAEFQTPNPALPAHCTL